MTTAADSQLLAPARDQGHRNGLTDMARWVRIVGYVTVVLALTSAAVTFLVLTGLTPLDPTPDVVQWALGINGVLVAILVGIIGWEIVRLIHARRRGRAGARLHIRFVMLFSGVAVMPAILVAVVATITLNRGLDYWFSTRTQAIVETSVQVADAYLQEHGRTISTDLMSMKPDIERARSLFEEDRPRFQTFFNNLAAFHGLPGVFLVRRDGTEVAAAKANADQVYPSAPVAAIGDAAASDGMPALIAPGATNLVGGIIKLDGFDDLYLYGIREIDPQVIRYLQMTTENAAEYRRLQAQRLSVQVAFGLLYLGISLVVLLSAIWLGLAFANRLVAPIRGLINAADQVAGGDLMVEVPVHRSDGDIGLLGSSFNKMTSQLRGQREALVDASEHIDSRRRFIEAVLSGVTAGVVGTDREGVVTVVNRMALRLLNVTSETAIGVPVTDLVPELEAVIEAARSGDGRPEHRDQISLARSGRDRTINVRVTTEGTTADNHGYVITLDDITDLVTAQRSSAWADVARRIAHEIKNPLTPIQLSAERLKRKFGKVIADDKEVFDQCTDTIIRQVGDIGRMVDEFSSFARMPKPTMAETDLRQPIRDAVFLMQVGYPDIDIAATLPDEPLVSRIDERLISQAFTNLIKNATEAIAAVPPDLLGKGQIRLDARHEAGSIVVEITDNGIGLPTENRQRLLEPYMTTREKGTGLGLAIVRKIVEEHGGRIELLDAPAVAQGGRGAQVRLVFPAAATAAPSQPEGGLPTKQTATEHS